MQSFVSHPRAKSCAATASANQLDPRSLYWGYLLGAGAMILGGVVAAFLAVDAEGKSLEDVAKPLSVIAKPAATIFRSGGHGPLPSAGD